MILKVRKQRINSSLYSKKRVVNALMNVKFSESDITTLKEESNNDDSDNFSNKWNPDGIKKRLVNDNSIVFSAFDLSTKRIVSETDPLTSLPLFTNFVVILIIRHYSNQSSSRL